MVLWPLSKTFLRPGQILMYTMPLQWIERSSSLLASTRRSISGDRDSRSRVPFEDATGRKSYARPCHGRSTSSPEQHETLFYIELCRALAALMHSMRIEWSSNGVRIDEGFQLACPECTALCAHLLPEFTGRNKRSRSIWLDLASRMVEFTWHVCCSRCTSAWCHMCQVVLNSHFPLHG